MNCPECGHEMSEKELIEHLERRVTELEAEFFIEKARRVPIPIVVPIIEREHPWPNNPWWPYTIYGGGTAAPMQLEPKWTCIGGSYSVRSGW